jgi:hypothetical protein
VVSGIGRIKSSASRPTRCVGRLPKLRCVDQRECPGQALNRPWQFGHCGVFGATRHPHCRHSNLATCCWSSSIVLHFSCSSAWSRSRSRPSASRGTEGCLRTNASHIGDYDPNWRRLQGVLEGVYCNEGAGLRVVRTGLQVGLRTIGVMLMISFTWPIYPSLQIRAYPTDACGQRNPL